MNIVKMGGQSASQTPRASRRCCPSPSGAQSRHRADWFPPTRVTLTNEATMTQIREQDPAEPGGTQGPSAPSVHTHGQHSLIRFCKHPFPNDTDCVLCHERRNQPLNRHSNTARAPGAGGGVQLTPALPRQEGEHSLGHDASDVAGVQRGVLLLLLRRAVHGEKLGTEKAALLPRASRAHPATVMSSTQSRSIKAASVRTTFKLVTVYAHTDARIRVCVCGHSPGFLRSARSPETGAPACPGTPCF